MSWMWVARAGGLERDAHAQLTSRRAVGQELGPTGYQPQGWVIPPAWAPGRHRPASRPRVGGLARDGHAQLTCAGHYRARSRAHSCIAGRELGDSSRAGARQASARRHGHVYLALTPTSPPGPPHGDSGDASTAPMARGSWQRLPAGADTGWRDTPPPACTLVSHAPLHHAHHPFTLLPLPLPALPACHHATLPAPTCSPPLPACTCLLACIFY